jgi:hypothetical protein
MNLHPYFPHLLSDWGEIKRQSSARNAVRIFVLRKTLEGNQSYSGRLTAACASFMYSSIYFSR